MEMYILILGVIGVVCLIVVKFLPQKNTSLLTDEEENELSIYNEYGESKDDYTIVESRQITSLPSIEDEERWIKEVIDNEIEEEEDEEEWIDENFTLKKSWGIKYRLDWKKGVEIRDFTKTSCCNDENGKMKNPLCKTIFESKLNYKRSEIEKMSLELGYSVFDNVGNVVNEDGSGICSCRWRSIRSN